MRAVGAGQTEKDSVCLWSSRPRTARQVRDYLLRWGKYRLEVTFGVSARLVWVRERKSE